MTYSANPTEAISQSPLIPLEDFIEQYRRLAGHIAWDFVRRSRSSVNMVLTEEDAEDFAAIALLKLVKCPPDKRGEKFYVNRLIVNAIINAWHKRLKTMGAESEPNSLWGHLELNEEEATRAGDIFDCVPGPDGLHGKTQTKFDYAKIANLLPTIPAAERLVIELNFGLGCPAIGIERVGKKLGRSRYWAEARLKRGISRIREQLTSQQQISAV